MGRRLGSVLLFCAFAALLVPLAFHAGPPLAKALAGAPDRAAAVPAHQRPAAGVGPAEGVTPAAGPAPDPAALAALLDPLLSLQGPGTLSASVIDAATGTELYGRGADTPATPASNLKLLTAAAAVSTLGADTRLRTTAWLDPASGTVVLRGGGDVMLGAGRSAGDQADPPADGGQDGAGEDTAVGRAGLATLAAEAAAVLADELPGGTVTVTVDDTLFTGPALSPAWAEGDVEAGEIAPVHALALTSGWAAPGVRSADPALDAGAAFRDALAAAADGFSVDPELSRGTAGPEAREVAAVESATIAEQVRQMLLDSDNYAAEALGRLTAEAAGRPASNDGARTAVLEAVDRLGLDTTGMALGDVSGLGEGTRVSAGQLSRLVALLLTAPDDGLRGVARSLPVAGLTGTLENRYGDGSAGAGVVRAKTGTLFAVTSLGGYVTDADGRLLAFAFVADGLDGNLGEARAVVDAAAAALAACGCS